MPPPSNLLGVNWLKIESSLMTLGECKGSYPNAAHGPRYETNVQEFWIAETYPKNLEKLSLEESENLFSSVDVPHNSYLRLPSEAEWQAVFLQTNIKPPEKLGTSDEYHSPSRWGSPLDGRSWTKERCNIQNVRTSTPLRSYIFSSKKKYRRFPILSSDTVLCWPIWIENKDEDHLPPKLSLPHRPPSNVVRIREEIISFIIFGGSAMCIALYNSPYYALSQPVNILLGGAFVSIFTGLFWRPSRKVIRI